MQSIDRPHHVVVNGTVIHLNDEQYWLYTIVDPESDAIIQHKTRN